MSFKCTNCESNFDNIISLSLHYRKIHKKTSKDLYDEYFLNGKAPTCACGCKSEVKFLDISRGYSTYARGHQSRVNNNFQTEKSRTNSIKTRRKMLEEGTWKPFTSNETGNVWNAGLTKEDPRIAAAISKRQTDEYKKISSERMREGRISGKIPTLRGENHSQWNGGTSPLLNFCHSNKKLFQEWKYPILAAASFTCKECNKQNKEGSSVELHVHHDKMKMSTIIRLIAEQEGWTSSYALNLDKNSNYYKIKNRIADKVAQFHIDNKVSGVVLCKECHADLHDKMNF